MSIRVVASVLIAAAGVGLGAQTDPPSPPPAAEPALPEGPRARAAAGRPLTELRCGSCSTSGR